MNGIRLESGINNCHWNVGGKCTNPDVTRNHIQPAFSRDWGSKQNCTLTIIGVHKCGGYQSEGIHPCEP